MSIVLEAILNIETYSFSIGIIKKDASFPLPLLSLCQPGWASSAKSRTLRQHASTRPWGGWIPTSFPAGGGASGVECAHVSSAGVACWVSARDSDTRARSLVTQMIYVLCNTRNIFTSSVWIRNISYEKNILSRLTSVCKWTI